MPKRPELPPFRPQLRLKNALHTQIYADGRIIMRPWPRKRPGHGTKAQQAARATAGWVWWATKFRIAQEVDAATELAAHTLFVPRDLLEKASYGTLLQINTRSGTVWYGERLVTSQAQALLDQITTVTGAILTRGADGWIAILPNEDGRVLTTHGNNRIPSWDPVSGGGGGGGANPAFAPPLLDPSTGSLVGANSALLLPVYAQRAMTLESVTIPIQALPTTLRVAPIAFAARASDYKPDGQDMLGGATTLTDITTTGPATLVFPTPIPLDAGTFTWVGFYARSSGTYQMMSTAIGRPGRWFTNSTDTLPATCPATNTSSSANTGFWPTAHTAG